MNEPQVGFVLPPQQQPPQQPPPPSSTSTPSSSTTTTPSTSSPSFVPATLPTTPAASSSTQQPSSPPITATSSTSTTTTTTLATSASAPASSGAVSHSTPSVTPTPATTSSLPRSAQPSTSSSSPPPSPHSHLDPATSSSSVPNIQQSSAISSSASAPTTTSPREPKSPRSRFHFNPIKILSKSKDPANHVSTSGGSATSTTGTTGEDPDVLPEMDGTRPFCGSGDRCISTDPDHWLRFQHTAILHPTDLEAVGDKNNTRTDGSETNRMPSFDSAAKRSTTGSYMNSRGQYMYGIGGNPMNFARPSPPGRAGLNRSTDGSRRRHLSHGANTGASITPSNDAFEARQREKLHKRVRDLLSIIRAMKACLDHWETDFFAVHDMANSPGLMDASSDVSLVAASPPPTLTPLAGSVMQDTVASESLSSPEVQAKLQALLQITKVLEEVPSSSEDNDYQRQKRAYFKTPLEDGGAIGANRILRSVDFAFWQLRSKLSHLSTAISAAGSIDDLRPWFPLIRAASSIVAEWDEDTRAARLAIKHRKKPDPTSNTAEGDQSDPSNQTTTWTQAPKPVWLARSRSGSLAHTRSSGFLQREHSRLQQAHDANSDGSGISSYEAEDVDIAQRKTAHRSRARSPTSPPVPLGLRKLPAPPPSPYSMSPSAPTTDFGGRDKATASATTNGADSSNEERAVSSDPVAAEPVSSSSASTPVGADSDKPSSSASTPTASADKADPSAVGTVVTRPVARTSGETPLSRQAQVRMRSKFLNQRGGVHSQDASSAQKLTLSPPIERRQSTPQKGNLSKSDENFPARKQQPQQQQPAEEEDGEEIADSEVNKARQKIESRSTLLLSLSIDSFVTLPDSLIPRKAKRLTLRLDPKHRDPFSDHTAEDDADVVTAITSHTPRGDGSQSGAVFSGHRLTELLVMRKRNVNLAFKGLSTLPADLFKLSILTSLDLTGNKLTALPPELTQLAALRILKFSNNRVKQLPDEIGDILSLTEIHARRNDIAVLPSTIVRLSNLQVLELPNNCLSSLPKAIGDLAELRSLDLFRNKLEGPLPTSFSQLSSLTLLDLNGNTGLGPISPKCIASLQSLQVLRLWGCMVITAHTPIDKISDVSEIEGTERIDGDVDTSALDSAVKHDAKTLLESSQGKKLEAMHAAAAAAATPSDKGKERSASIASPSDTAEREERSERHSRLMLGRSGTMAAVISSDAVAAGVVSVAVNDGKARPVFGGRPKPARNNVGNLLRRTFERDEDNNRDIQSRRREEGSTSGSSGSSVSSVATIGSSSGSGSSSRFERYIAARDQRSALILQSVIARLPDLRELSMCGNGLASASGFKEILLSGGLYNLTSLNLSSNSLPYLPSAVCHLNALTALDIQHNRITLVPPELAKLSQLVHLALDDNPLQSPPAGVIRRGLEHIRSYFEGILYGTVFDPLVEACLKVCCFGNAEQGDLEQLRGILVSWPGRGILRHALHALKEYQELSAKGQKQLYRTAKLKMYLLLLACEDAEVMGTILEAIQGHIMKRPEMVVMEGGVGPLMRTMKANAAWQRPLLEYNAAYLLVQLCTALCSPPSYEQMDEGNSATPNISASGEVQPLKILRRQISYLDLKETQLLATAIAKMKVPAEICRIGGPSFIQHFISIARADCQHLPTLLALTFSNLATVHMPIDPADLEFAERIGTGVSANVFRGKWKGREVAIKKYHTQLVNLQEVLNEVAILSVLESPQILKCLGACIVSPNLYLVSEYFPMGSVFDLLHGKRAEERVRTGHWDLLTATGIAIDTALGLQYLHSMNVVHRDIKSQNLLLRRDFSACIADLGISRIVGPQMTKAMGTPRYMAPEVIGGKAYDITADVYSFGILYWELLTGKMPYSEVTSGWQVAAAVTSGKRPPPDESWPDCIKELLFRAWHQEPSQRPTLAQVISALEDIRESLRNTNLSHSSMTIGMAKAALAGAESSSSMSISTAALASMAAAAAVAPSPAADALQPTKSSGAQVPAAQVGSSAAPQQAGSAVPTAKPAPNITATTAAPAGSAPTSTASTSAAVPARGMSPSARRAFPSPVLQSRRPPPSAPIAMGTRNATPASSSGAGAGGGEISSPSASPVGSPAQSPTTAVGSPPQPQQPVQAQAQTQVGPSQSNVIIASGSSNGAVHDSTSTSATTNATSTSTSTSTASSTDATAEPVGTVQEDLRHAAKLPVVQ